ncbi:hypothetical protein GOEFS_119_00110 [Gordonia effusa NBRC 100432]|uniref:Uncharacterized protein n=1 Tax=Gordonia effusa NBRC 100432 TaxID=1077974 RepID=H0R620_9ACTN|nr:hypothetical protein [Gordonia effusa]GAB20521.1 hypothetical protein GOEFS_119_00110 [Gordonia effusa NBRC 100432]
MLAGGIAAAGMSLFAAPAAQAAPTQAQIINLPAQNGHRAFGIGPFPSSQACQPTANRLTNSGARNFGGVFGNCVPINGSWYAVSPWYA